MKRAEMTINFDNDTAMILGSQIKLIISSSGHYCLPLSQCILSENVQTNIVLLSSDLKNMLFAEKKTKAMKLHRQDMEAPEQKLRKAKFSKRQIFNLLEQVSNS